MAKNFTSVTRNLRLAYKETQKEFAERMDVSVSTIRRWERGKVKNWDRVEKADSLDRRDNYFRYEKKQGYQLQLQDQESGNKFWTRLRAYEDQEEMLNDIGLNGKQYKNMTLQIANFRTIALKK